MRRLLAPAIAFLLLIAALDDRELAFEVGLPAVRPAAELQPGQETCRARIDAADDFDRVRLVVATFGEPGPALEVTVAGRRGEVAAGYPDNSSVDARVGHVAAGSPLRACVRNAGATPVAIFGSPPNTPPDDLGDPDLEPLPAVVFVREPPESMLSLVPEAFERSALFKTGWFGAWTAWALLAVVLVALPAALAAAWRSARGAG
jgi:hypothetical protein